MYFTQVGPKIRFYLQPLKYREATSTTLWSLQNSCTAHILRTMHRGDDGIGESLSCLCNRRKAKSHTLSYVRVHTNRLMPAAICAREIAVPFRGERSTKPFQTLLVECAA